MPKRQAVAIVAGWAEGYWQTKKFRSALERTGYQVTQDPSAADVIIGHSLGCYLIPKEVNAKSIVLIGLPYWPGRSILTSLRLKLKSEIRSHRKDESLGWWLNKMLHNGWYIISRPSKTYHGFTKQIPDDLPDGSGNKVLLVRPTYDTFCHPEVMSTLGEAKNYKYFEIPGAHDDCWLKPKPYIDLLLKEL